MNPPAKFQGGAHRFAFPYGFDAGPDRPRENPVFRIVIALTAKKTTKDRAEANPIGTGA